METRSSKLRKLRIDFKKSQREFGDILGIHPNMYQKYEYGNIELPVKHAKKLGEVFGFDWWVLYED